MNPVILLVIFALSALIGYKLIKNVPSLLHTPLMSGMNALGGITLLAALTAVSAALLTGSKVMGYLAIVLSMVNVAGGFAVTQRMLNMLRQKKTKSADTEGSV